jgi:hypothetical protein
MSRTLFAMTGMIYILTENPTIDRIVTTNDILGNWLRKKFCSWRRR